MNDKLIKVIEGAIKNSPLYYREFQNYTDIYDFYSSFKLDKDDIINNMYDIISKKYDGNLYLHAYSLSFNHPVTKERLEFNLNPSGGKWNEFFER